MEIREARLLLGKKLEIFARNYLSIQTRIPPRATFVVKMIDDEPAYVEPRIDGNRKRG